MRRILNVQGLRAVAVLLVIAAHEHVVLDRFHVHSIFRTFTAVEAWGVDLFFVISGFVMVSVHWNDFGVPGAPVGFLVRRMIRIFPMYWLVTMIVFAIVTLMPSQVHTWPTAKANLFWSLVLLVPNNKPVLLSLGWTLVFEMYFYYVFTATLFLSRRSALRIIGGWSALLIVLQFGPRPADLWLATLANGLVVEFTFGVLAGVLVANRRLLPIWAGFAAMATACVLLAIAFRFTYNPAQELFTGAPLRFASVGIPMALLVYGAVSVELGGGFVVPKVLRDVGDASYSIYLTHPLFYVGLSRVVATAHGHVPGSALVVIGPIVVLLGGCAAYRFVERPLLQITRGQMQRALPRIMRPSIVAGAAPLGSSVSG